MPLLLFAGGCSRPHADDGPTAAAAQALSQQCVTIQRGTFGTVADATIANNVTTPGWNTGTLKVAPGVESLLRFDVSSIPASATINSATLSLTTTTAFSGEKIFIKPASASWSESTVTYASFNQQILNRVMGQLVPIAANTVQTVNLNTAGVQAWVNGSIANNGVVLEIYDLPAQWKDSVFVSSESATVSLRPKLDVCYTPFDYCAAAPCLNGATCQSNASDYTCICAPGYTGTNCEININDCAPMPCLNGGTCTDLVNGYSCACAPGFTGTHCQTDINECAPAPCQNGGVCTDLVNGYSCACPLGFTGTNCEININDCAPQPCQNGGTCTDLVNGYTCACPVGFVGQNCQINIDDCVGNQCQNGSTCIDGIAGYTCACAPGWSGTYCQNNIDDCAGNPCQNGGACVDGVNGYTCNCAPGYTGTNCEIDIDDCLPNPCQNGATCTDGVNAYTCQCTSGWMGPNCDQPATVTCPCVGQPNFDYILAHPAQCSTQPANNLGTVEGMDVYGYPYDIAAVGDILGDGNLGCTTLFDLYVFGAPPTPVTPAELTACIAAMDQAGTAAGLSCPELDDCASSPCLNGGTCYDGTHAYSCACPSGFSGKNCEIADPCTPNNPCQNGGACNSSPPDYTCTCPMFYTGTNCETPCPVGYGGPGCATPLKWCALLKQQNPALGDGTYTFDVSGHQVDIYCYNMAQNPTEYLSLAKTGTNYNYSTYAPDQTTWYTKVRFYPDTLTVDPQDATFATTVGTDVQNFPTVPWATAEDCIDYGSHAGTANVDLTGTPFALAPNQLTTQGWYPAGSVSYGQLLKTADLTGGGYCGMTGTANYASTPVQLVFQAECPCTGGALWDANWSTGSLTFPAYQGPAGDVTVTSTPQMIYIVGALNSTNDPNYEYADFAPYSSCGVYDINDGSALEQHVGLTDAQANACISIVTNSCEAGPCFEGTCSMGGGLYTCQCPDGVSGQNCEVAPAICPSGLTSSGQVWQADIVQLDALPKVHLTATFQNDTGDTFAFNQYTELKYGVRYGTTYLFPPMTYVQKPSGDVPPGGQFTFEVTFDTSGLPAGAHQLFVEPHEGNLYGDLPPYYASLVTASFECTQPAVACPCTGAQGWLPSNGFASCGIGPSNVFDGSTEATQSVFTNGGADQTSAGYFSQMGPGGGPPYDAVCYAYQGYGSSLGVFMSGLTSAQVQACINEMNAFVAAAGGTCSGP
jgi:hypothetical protein